MQTLPVTYPHGPVALMHALMPGPQPYPGPPQPGPQPYPGPPQPGPQPCPQCPWPCPWPPGPHHQPPSPPSSCGNGVLDVTGEVGTAFATPPTPSPRAG